MKYRFVAVIGSLMALWPALALAHAHVTESVPKSGEMVMRPLPAVVLTFSEAVEPRFSKIEVTDQKSGTRIDDGKVVSKGKNLLSTTIKQPLKDGAYHVVWKATAKDTHRSHGQFDFTFMSHM